MLIKPPYVLGFVGENANGILRWSTEMVLAGFEKYGLDHQLIDLVDPSWPQQLNGCLAIAKPAFCFSFQSIGTDIRADDNSNVWARLDIPFLTHNNDNPYHCPVLHRADAPCIYRFFGAEDFLQSYVRYFKGRGFSGLLDCGFPTNPLAGRTAWKERSHKLVFAKTGMNAALLRQKWQQFPSRIRSVLEEAAEQALSGRPETIAELCEQGFRARNLDWGERIEFFFSVCSMVDFYLRALRAERMVKAVMRYDALIVGNWSHLETTGARARFLESMPATELDALYADSQVAINTLPTTRFGLHERILSGFFARASVISDSTPYLHERLKAFPSFIGLNIDDATFPDALDQAVQASLQDPDGEEKRNTSFTEAAAQFSVETFARELMECLTLDEYRHAHEGWSPTAKR